MVLSSDKVQEYEAVVGSKAIRLAELSKGGFLVPAFVVISADQVSELATETEQSKESAERYDAVCVDILQLLPATLYAVRSAALIEDGYRTSYAGQFKTVLRVKGNELAEAIRCVLADARQKLRGGEEFSIIVQEYIDPEYAGVVFSRDPRGSREMVIEYRLGGGEAVVGGAAVNRITFLSQNAINFKSHLKVVVDLAKIATAIEGRYDWP